jgi:hypothetical protein
MAGFRLRVTGFFDNATGAAISSMYRKAGYSPSSSVSEGATPSASSPTSTSTSTPNVPTLQLPRAEVAIISSLPAYIVSAPKLGTELQATDAVIVESGEPVATAQVDAASANSLKSGLSVSLQPTGRAAIPATLKSIGPTDKDGNVLITFAASAGSSISDSLLHQAVLATIVRQTVSKKSLIVPSRAVITSGNQSAHVLKLDSNGKFEVVKVTEIGALDGQSAVVPDDPQDLTISDFVKVG